jgi:hypothetical protein
MSRTYPLVAVAALALTGGGCGSNNSGKIVGRWKADTGDLGKVAPSGPVDVVWEFTDDGSFSVSRVKAGESKGDTVAAGRYALGIGNNVSFTNLQPPLDGKSRATEKIAIDGDTMTVGGGKDKSFKFTRLPPAP